MFAKDLIKIKFFIKNGTSRVYLIGTHMSFEEIEGNVLCIAFVSLGSNNTKKRVTT